jgi:hypothetical protein
MSGGRGAAGTSRDVVRGSGPRWDGGRALLIALDGDGARAALAHAESDHRTGVGQLDVLLSVEWRGWWSLGHAGVFCVPSISLEEVASAEYDGVQARLAEHRATLRVGRQVDLITLATRMLRGRDYGLVVIGCGSRRRTMHRQVAAFERLAATHCEVELATA